LKTGKIPNDILDEIIRGNRSHRPEVVVGPGVGKDYAAVDLGGDLCVLSSDPITAAGKNAGRIAVHVAVNDAAVCGAKPVGLITVILLPEGTSKAALKKLTSEIESACDEIDVEVLGGHTEVTPAVNKPIIISTVVARVGKDKMVSSSGAKAGDSIILTKSAGMEGTAIIAADHEDDLKNVFDSAFLNRCKDMIKNISVLAEGRIASRNGATSMHDVTEGGFLGALWEICESSGNGAVVEHGLIPVAEETTRLCRHFDIDPLKLISSGSMLITCANPEVMLCALHDAGIEASCVGTIVPAGDGIRITGGRGGPKTVKMPDSDEIYRV
jgi:hydrogenase maturation factor